jgi:hypothetical protein
LRDPFWTFSCRRDGEDMSSAKRSSQVRWE